MASQKLHTKRANKLADPLVDLAIRPVVTVSNEMRVQQVLDSKLRQDSDTVDDDYEEEEEEEEAEETDEGDTEESSEGDSESDANSDEEEEPRAFVHAKNTTASSTALSPRPLVVETTTKQHRHHHQPNGDGKRKRKNIVRNPQVHLPPMEYVTVADDDDDNNKLGNNEKLGSIFERKWSDADQLLLLNHILAYKTKHGIDPNLASLSEFKGYAVNFNARQIQSKMASMKRKFVKMTLTNPDLHEIASKIWVEETTAPPAASCGGGHNLKRAKLEAVGATNTVVATKTMVPLPSNKGDPAELIADLIARFTSNENSLMDMRATAKSLYALLDQEDKQRANDVITRYKKSTLKYEIKSNIERHKRQMIAASKLSDILTGDSD